MRKFLSVVAVGFAMIVGSTAMAKDAKPLHGKVTAVAPDKDNAKIEDITVSVHGKKGEAPVDTIIKADDTAKITKDGAAGALTDVTVGMSVTVTMDGDKVTAIEVKSPKKKAAAPAAAK